jgi:hypothetical protein
MRWQPPVDLTGALGGPRLADLFREREGDALIITNSSSLQRTGFFPRLENIIGGHGFSKMPIILVQIPYKICQTYSLIFLKVL